MAQVVRLLQAFLSAREETIGLNTLKSFFCRLALVVKLALFGTLPLPRKF
jgi:hypothetical protein